MCKCQWSEEKFRVDGVAQGRSRIRVVGSLGCHSGDVGTKEAVRKRPHVQMPTGPGGGMKEELVG